MLNTLHGKLSLVLLGLLCLMGFLYLALTLFTTRLYFQEVNQKVNRRLAADLTTHLAARGLLQPARQGRARAEIKELMAINPSVEVYLLDAQGEVQTYSVAPETVKRRRVSLAPIRLFLSGAAPLPILGDDPRDFNRQKVFSAASYSAEGQTGYVYVILGGEDYNSAAQRLERSVILRSSLAMAAVILTFALAAGLLFFRLLTWRLRRLARSMEQFHGDVPRAPPSAPPSAQAARPRDEIDRLDLVYQQMAGRIRAQMQELTQADTLRRELVGNVSHDLRTPLAALQGYLETLLMKEGLLTAAQQRDYLMIALRHSQRLAALVSELFELARLDSGEAQVQPEPFALGELVQDILQQFQLAADAKKVRLECRSSEALPFVFAEVGLIARVLENLLENALRYTPEGGAVMVLLEPSGERVRVQVRDTGQGISPEDLPHIFKRFYRARSQAEGIGGGAGLGLAITRRILELHGSPLEVQSALQEGTAFTFFLPAQASRDQNVTFP